MVFPLSRLAARMRPMGCERHDGAYRKRGEESHGDEERDDPWCRQRHEGRAPKKFATRDCAGAFVEQPDGAFAPLLRLAPMRALLLPFGGAGGLVVLEYLAMWWR